MFYLCFLRDKRGFAWSSYWTSLFPANLQLKICTIMKRPSWEWDVHMPFPFLVAEILGNLLFRKSIEKISDIIDVMRYKRSSTHVRKEDPHFHWQTRTWEREGSHFNEATKDTTCLSLVDKQCRWWKTLFLTRMTEQHFVDCCWVWLTKTEYVVKIDNILFFTINEN